MELDKTNKKHNKRLSIVIFIILVIAIVLIVGYAYAKYVTSKRGEAQAEIAEWNVAIKINENTDENIVVDLADTRNNEKEEADVQDGYVAPGTAGMFNIEVNAENSDVSLEYEINMNVDYGDNEKFPQNLIFYSDPDMQNAFYHTDNTIKLNGFIGYNDSEKTETIPIYWRWAYETGTTDEDREKNDELDSEWMGRTVEPLQLKIIARQVNTNQDENPMANQYEVTLDANGGTIQGYGNATQVTKKIISGENYGELPTPVREGYTFEGWYKPTYDTYNFASLDFGNNLNDLRISPLNYWSISNKFFNVEDVLYYDITVEGTSIEHIDINDININDYIVTNTGTQISIKGKTIISNEMIRGLNSQYYAFLDVSMQSTPTSYTIHRFQLHQFKDEDKVDSTKISISKNHALTAKWKKNE